jgi:hypothetical protein
VVVMENKEYGEVIGRPSARYVNRLARRGALATSSFAVSHPSLPNYLALTGGSTFGIASDCTDCSVSGPSLVDQLSGAHIPWKAYMGDLPHPCFGGAFSRGYAKKHDPFAYYRRIVGDPARCRRIVSFDALAADLRAGTLPTFSWISPNQCDDMHDCSVATGDRFLARLVPSLLHELGPHGLLILTWDEGSTDRGCCGAGGGGHVPTILAGPAARAGTRSAQPVNHYSVLATVEDALGLARLGQAGCRCTPSLATLLRGPVRIRPLFGRR